MHRTSVSLLQVEAKTRHEVEEKKQALRQVVGGSYRELIASADTILEIASSCHNVIQLVTEIQLGLQGLSSGQDLPVGGTAAASLSAGSFDELYGEKLGFNLSTTGLLSFLP